MDKKSHPKIYGILGYPAKHSLSPAMHNAAFRALKINAEYRIFEKRPEELQDFLLKGVFENNISGLNITIPYKVKAKELLEKEFPLRQKDSRIQQDLYYMKLSGAINTIKINDNKIEYYNTDSGGFLRSLKEDLNFIDTKNKNVLLIGCGGAGRAIIASLSWQNVEIRKIYIYDINEEAINSAKKHFSQLPQCSYLEEKLQFISSSAIPLIIEDCNLLVNASPVGMKEEDVSIIDKNLLKKNRDLSVYDVVYNRKTQLIKDAEELGLPVAGGLGMLLYQGVSALELWLGLKEPLPVEIASLMRQALEEGVNKL